MSDTDIAVEDLSQRISAGGVVIVDVRIADEHCASHVDGGRRST